MVIIMPLFFACSNQDDSTPSIPSGNSLSIGVEINPNDPLACIIGNTEGDTIHIFAQKDEKGLPMTLSEIVIRQENGNAADIMFDELERPVYIEAPNGVIYTLDWQSETFASLVAIDNTTGEQINTYIDLTEDSDEVEMPQHATKNAVENRRTGHLSMNLKPIGGISDRMHGATVTRSDMSQMNTSGKILLNITECDSPVDYPCGVDLYYKGYFRTRIMGEKISQGVYEVQLPTSMYSDYEEDYKNAGTGCENYFNSGIAQFLNKTCILSGITGAIGFQQLAKIIGLRIAASVGTTGPLAVGIGVVATLHATYCGLIDGPKEYLCDWMKSIKHYFQENEYEQSYNVSLWPRVWNTSFGLTFSPIDVDLRAITFDHLDLPLGGNPSISTFTLNPSAPMSGVSYAAIAELYCIPTGSVVFMCITGTDGYYDEMQEVINSTSKNYTATLYVPGASQGVRDICEIVITTPDGKQYSKTASLIFQ